MKYNIQYFIPIPFVYNFVNNLIENNYQILHTNSNSLFLSFICFICLYNIGKLIANSLNFENISLSISLFLLSFFVFNFITLFLDKYFFTFHSYFLLTIMFWSIVLLLNFNKLKFLNIFSVAISFLFIRFLSRIFNDISFDHIELSSDTKFFWTPMSKMIYENSLFFALENNIIQGYGLLINYIHAINFKIFLNFEEFVYTPVITNIFLFLGLLFLYELSTNNSIKLTTCLIYISIILNSDWLSFLYFNSSMGETVINYIFPIIFLSIFNQHLIFKKELRGLTLYALLIVGGFLYFSKPFVSYLILLSILIFTVIKKDLMIFLFGFIGLFINFINYKFVISGNTQDGYLNSSEISNINSLFNFNFENIRLIITNFYELDKVTLLFILIVLLLVIFNVLKTKKINNSIYILLFNIFLVFYLYSTIWQNKEIESAYRYVFTFINLYFFIYIDELNKFNQFTKR